VKIVGRRRWLQDVAVVSVVTVVTGADALWNQPGTRQADGWTLGLLGLSVAAVVVRRRWPVPVAVVCGLALTVWYGLGHRGELLYLPSAVALYTVAVTGSRRLTVLAGVVAVMWSAGLAWVLGDRSSAPVTEMLWPVVTLLLGEVVRGRRELQAEHAAREARAAAGREAEAARRVEQERLRIAREVHDVVAHTMAAVNVQMGVATAAFDERPEVARTALQQARTSSREALQELRTTVSLLREAAPAGPDEPAPDLGRLSELVAGARRAGLQVSLDTNVDGHDVPLVSQLAAYRIVQEALTNVVRHSRAGSAVVSVMCEHDSLVVEVRDDGVGDTRRPDDPSAGSGYGLIGMAERATAVGGRVRWGTLPSGGFRVRAELPLIGTGP
jgi:signal transduction histidine kinase